jgi:hypothetical protein
MDDYRDPIVFRHEITINWPMLVLIGIGFLLLAILIVAVLEQLRRIRRK